MSGVFSKYYDLGLNIIPLRGKQALVSWKQYQERRPDRSFAEAWDNTSHNVGIITGHVSEILVVDVDGEYPSDWPPMPDTWTVKTRNGYHYYFYLGPDDDFKNSVRIKEEFDEDGNKIGAVDIRSNGGYVAAPPSRHPDGGLYEWLESKSPDDVKISNIPDFVRSTLEEKTKALYRGQDDVKTAVEPLKTQSNDDDRNRLDDDDRKQAYIDAAVKAECDALRSTGEGGRNDQLNRSAFALAGLLPDDKVFSLLEPIAREIGLSPVEIQKTIKSGCDSAESRGVPEQAMGLPEPEAGASLNESSLADAEMMPLVKNILERHGKKVEHNEIAPHLIERAPGILGEMVRWILGTSLYPQPILALASAIPAAGVLMAHKVKTETGLRSNFFSLGIAESGAGKDHARKCIRKLFDNVGMKDNLLGDPASSTAVFASMKRASGRGLIQIDEFGRFLESMRGRNAASHVRQITTNFMHMYNNADEFFTGQEYADNEANGGRNDIDQPCLGIYATTVPDNFYKNLSSDEAVDGFLSRWLIFETTRFDTRPTINGGIQDVPDSLLHNAKYWVDHPTFNGDGGDFGSYTMVKPRVVPFDDDAKKMFFDMIYECRDQMSNSKDPIEKAFLNRTAEHAAKLALIGHEGDTISASVMQWACDLSMALTKANVRNIKANVASSAYEAELQKVLKIIKRFGDMTKSEVTKSTQSIDRRKRQDILDTLVEAGDIIQYKREKEGKRPITCYKVAK